MSKMRRILLIAIPSILLPLVYIFDVIRSAVHFEFVSLDIFREVAIIVSFALIGLYVDIQYKNVSQSPAKKVGRVFFAAIIALLVVGVSSLFKTPDIAGQESLPIHRSALLLISSSATALMLAIVALYILFVLKDFILFKRKKTTRRYYILYLVLLVVACVIELPIFRLNDTVISSIVFSASIVLISINSFRQNWIVYLSKREKIYSIIYSVLLFLILVVLDVFLAHDGGSNRAIATYSHPLHTFIQLNIIFGTVYFSITFVSTLFHLPTAEVFERKQSELHSLHNLGRLITQVFDFNDLVNTVTQMTSEVCGARSVWLELYSFQDTSADLSIDIVSRKNISQQEMNCILGPESTHMRRNLMDSQKMMLIEDVWSDRRTKHFKQGGFIRGSLLAVPLLSHNKVIGVLYATKEYQNSFDQDDVDVMTTFADHVSIAIENSRLIAKSIERERLHQEMMVAQRMQKRLLPQHLPNLSSVEFSAVSESSLEVGGDYYDIIHLSDQRIGIVVGDVSGKGVSAAFYMAEVKGIVLSLSKICSTPRELLLRANETLMETLEKNAFISAVYAVLDISKETLTLARAGHCPVIYISGDTAEQVRSTGIGLGLTNATQFEQATEERTIHLRRGDLCIFYTDGVTEARNENMEEYGCERMTQIARESRHESANVIQNKILEDIRTFIRQSAYEDDITLIVMKWLGTSEDERR